MQTKWFFACPSESSIHQNFRVKSPCLEMSGHKGIMEISNLLPDFFILGAIDYFHSDFKVVVDYFVKKRTDPEYRPKDPEKFRHVDELLKLMSVLTQDHRFEEVLEGEGGKPKDMCEVLDRVEARGKQEGVDETRIESIKNLMKNLKLTVKQAMDALGIPDADQPKYLARL